VTVSRSRGSRRVRSLLPLLLALSIAPAALAVPIGLNFGSFRIESPGIGDSGPIVISGTEGREGIESLSIEAFGKKSTLTPAQLQELHSFVFNGLQLSYANEPKQFGGRIVCVMFTAGLSGEVDGKRLVQVTDSGLVRVAPLP
jgi:hypothetical protein